MLPATLFCLLSSALLSLAHPLKHRALSSSASTITSPSASDTSSATTSGAPITANDGTVTSSLDFLFEGNMKFREQKDRSTNPSLTEEPEIMFISCSDNRYSPNDIFQGPIGGSMSQLNIANQFSRRDANSNAAVTYAIHSGIKHIIVMGHYGCKGVHMAMSPQPKSVDRILHTWLQPIIDIYHRSRRVEIKKLRDARKGKNALIESKADDAGFRALVEENVKASVKNLKDESILFTAYHKRNVKVKKVEVYVHGFVFDEENGEVKDLGVSFGPPGKVIPKVPFEAIPEAKRHGTFGKWKAKAKKLDPAPTFTSAPSTSMP